MGFDPSSRFALTEQALMAPGRCFVTGSEKGPFVDLHRDINFSETGRAYLSVAVLRELAEGANLFDEVREQAIAETVEAYSRGHNEGVTESGELAAAADRLTVALGRLGHGTRASDPILPQGEDGDAPAVLVVDGDDDRQVSTPVNGAAVEHGETSGQGDGPRRVRRPAGVSGGTGNGDNPFAI